MRFYIASRLENVERVRALAAVLQALGWVWTYDWTQHGPVADQGWERIREVARAEARGATAADVLFALLPGGRGTHVEIGLALAMERLIVLHAEDVTMFAPEAPSFYRHPGVVRMTCSFEEFLRLEEFFKEGIWRVEDAVFPSGC